MEQVNTGRPKAQRSGVYGENGNVAAGAASHQGLLDSQSSEGGVGSAAGAGQVHAAAGVAAQPAWVVIGKSVQPALALLRLRLGLLGLKAKIGVLALQQRDALSEQSQVIAQHRRRCVLVEQRLKFVEQRFKHFVSLGFAKAHRNAGGGA